MIVDGGDTLMAQQPINLKERLQNSTNLSSGNWGDLTTGIFTSGTNFVFTNATSGSPAFFRLKAH